MNYVTPDDTNNINDSDNDSDDILSIIDLIRKRNDKKLTTITAAIVIIV
jgi:hypothetical protein